MMSDNDLNNIPTEEALAPFEEDAELSSAPDDEKNEPHEGLTFKWLNLFIGIAIILTLGNNLFSGNWTFYLYLSIVVIIHEMGHVVAGKTFGCCVKEMQVFFLPFISYKPRQAPNGGSWRDITWSLGVLPLGGLTVFKSRMSDNKNDDDEPEIDPSIDEEESAASPYIEDKAAWQRLVISAAGVLFNIATFFILYLVMPFLPDDFYSVVRSLAVFSLVLAVLNILPIYPLDGGSVVFAIYELITGSRPSRGFTNACGGIGFILIVLLFWVFPESLGGLLSSVLGLFF